MICEKCKFETDILYPSGHLNQIANLCVYCAFEIKADSFFIGALNRVDSYDNLFNYLEVVKNDILFKMGNKRNKTLF